MKKFWTYNELPDGWYSASVSTWGNSFVFRAMPNRGAYCTECVEQDQDVLYAKIEQWLKGELPAGFYSSSY